MELLLHGTPLFALAESEAQRKGFHNENTSKTGLKGNITAIFEEFQM